MTTISGLQERKSPYKYLLLTVFLIILDQAIKLWMFYDVLPNHYGEIDIIPGFFKLHYVENKGMAFGWTLAGDYGKLMLTAFRLVAMVGICWYLVHLANRNAHSGLLWSIAAVLGGAIGNVIDSTFYGVLLGNAPFDSSTPWFHGQVIDMFYAYGLDGDYPDWIPFLGGQFNTTPIFNFADACIFCGVVSILIFQKSFFMHEEAPVRTVAPNHEDDLSETHATEEELQDTINEEQAPFAADNIENTPVKDNTATEEEQEPSAENTQESVKE